jgi:hypothetical protein
MTQASRCQYILGTYAYMYNKQIKLYSGVKSRLARSNLDYSRMQGSLLHRHRLDTDISEPCTIQHYSHALAITYPAQYQRTRHAIPLSPWRRHKRRGK